ncbi:MAG: hypothetical protein HQL38_02545 [Alphaproteobacteria bacterium]|nr:hypothetical protein [Alphaproteobacteria bacterium]
MLRKISLLAALGLALPAVAHGDDRQVMMEDALKAAPPGIADKATVQDWQGNVLRQGTGEYTCMPTPPNMKGTAPMCFDRVWMAWADAWSKKAPFTNDKGGVAYMMAGDEGASNFDPFAERGTAENQWVVEGPHLMLLMPTQAMDAFPVDPNNGGPYVMWKGTPYAHVMVPVGPRPAQPQISEMK